MLSPFLPIYATSGPVTDSVNGFNQDQAQAQDLPVQTTFR